MSDEVMDLWDYRQRLYCEAAKWVAGDIGSYRGGGQPSGGAKSVLNEGGYRRVMRAANEHQASSVAAYAPGSIAGIGYSIHLGRRKAFSTKNYGGRYGSE